MCILKVWEFTKTNLLNLQIRKTWYDIFIILNTLQLPCKNSSMWLLLQLTIDVDYANVINDVNKKELHVVDPVPPDPTI